MVEIAKNYESSTDARRLMRQVRGDQEQVNWTEKAIIVYYLLQILHLSCQVQRLPGY